MVMTLLVPAASAAADAQDVAAILARMRAAAASEALRGRAGDFLIRGRCRANESEGGYSVRFTAAGKFLQKTEGPLGDTRGFDGTTCWMIDRSGVFRTVELFDRDVRQLWVGLQTGLWLAHATPDTVALAPQGGDERTVVLDIRQGKTRAKLYVDRGTWLPRSLTPVRVSGEQTWTFAEYRDELGWKVPGKLSIDLGAGITNTYEVLSVSAAPAAAGVYDPVRASPTDAHFDPAVAPRIEVRRARTGHVLVHPRVDGLDLGWFIFDTGAGSSAVVDRTAAARLKLTPVGADRVTSIFGSVRCPILRGTSLQVGPLTLSRPFLMEMDLDVIRKALGDDVVGIIGYDLLSRCVARLDLAHDSIEIHDPRRYRLVGAAWQKLAFNRSLPLVPARFEGGQGLFRMDVGACGGAFGNVVFHAPAVEELHLLRGRTVKETQVASSRVALAKIGWFELAGRRFESPDVVFALDRKGPLGDEYVEGNLGVEFLRPFRIVLDYQHERVALRSTGR
jgi:hypothetical protein